MEISVQPIGTEAEYEAALENVADLMGVTKGRRRATDSMLVPLMEVYESKYWAID
jgi:hypothetical protein